MKYIRIFIKLNESAPQKQKDERKAEITRYLDSIGAEYEAEYAWENFQEMNRRKLLNSIDLHENLKEIVPGWGK